MSMPEVTLKASQRILTRPYEGLETLSRALELTSLVIDGTSYFPGTVNVPRESLPIRSGAIEIFLDIDALGDVLQALQIGLKDVSITCLAFGSVIAESCVLFDESLATFQPPQPVDLKGDPLVFASPNGFDLRVVLYLSANLRQRAFRPYRSGTWLAHARFNVSPYTSLSRFCPVPMDDTVRRALRITKSLHVLRPGWRWSPVDRLA